MASHEIIDIQSGSPLDTRLGEFGNALWAINDQLKPIDNAINNHSDNVGKWLSTINDTISAGFTSVVEAIAKINTQPPPLPKPKGTIMADFSIPDDTPDGRVTFHIAATDAEGQPITDPAALAALTLTVVGSNDDAFVVTLDADQPDPANRVGGYHVGAPGQAALTENLTDAGGNLIATGTDGFTVTTGKVALGSVDATFDGLTPIAP